MEGRAELRGHARAIQGRIQSGSSRRANSTAPLWKMKIKTLLLNRYLDLKMSKFCQPGLGGKHEGCDK